MVNVIHRPTKMEDEGRYQIVHRAETEAEATAWIAEQPNAEDLYFVPIAVSRD